MRADIIDAYHEDDLPLAQLIIEGVKGFILKATQGESYRDPEFQNRFKEATGLHAPLGSYHFLSNGPSLPQFNLFRATIAGKRTAIMVDYEHFEGVLPPFYLLENFVSLCVDNFGRHPIVYGNFYDLSQPWVDPDMMAKCPLMLSNFNVENGGELLIPKPWKTWDILQWTGAYNGGTLDASKFNLDKHPQGVKAWFDSMAIQA